ncbi:MAG TPA: hypothetical protein VK093_00065 [Candidatus Avipropionibacterium sp.]|nr:hypothetical protein [Candidatus Avipropionibacterium sp.]
MMNKVDDYTLHKEKTKLLTGIGCLFGLVTLGILFVLLPIYWFFSQSGERQLELSHSPNHINTIEIVQKNDFPDPSLRIRYGEKEIIKTKIPDTISIEWVNDFQAEVILMKKGREPSVVELDFQ